MYHSLTAPLQVQEVSPVNIDRVLQQWQAASPQFLLESGLEVGGTGRWSFWGSEPIDEFVQLAGSSADPGGAERPRRPLEDLDRWFGQWCNDQDHLDLLGERVPFTGGAVGWISYEALDDFHQLGPDQRSSPGAPEWLNQFPLMHFTLHDELFVQHRESGKTWFLHRGRQGWEERLASSLQASGNDPVDRHADTVLPMESKAQIRSAFDEDQYLNAVRQIQDGIGQGDYYEVNLARGYLVEGCPSPAELHRRWRRVQPVPYGALIETPRFGVVSASPEQFLQTRGTTIRTRPIKGTVPRSGDPERDRQAAEELRTSEKERAELAMIIDLERNDLGRICEPGSVEVTQVTAIESYASVLHAVATIEGQLSGKPGPGAILEATYPGGSITGAPKQAAMRAIRELEPWPRAVYTGSVGWIDGSGDLEFNIAIRTATIQGSEALIPFGGAITWDSDCHAESREIGHKARAILGALGLQTHPDQETPDLQE